MFDDAALVLEEIAPEDKTRIEVLRSACCSSNSGRDLTNEAYVFRMQATRPQ